MWLSFRFQVPIHFVPLSQGDEEQSSGGGMFLRSPPIRSPFFFTYPLRFALPNVAIEIATLRGYRMTFSHSSKDPLRPLT